MKHDVYLYGMTLLTQSHLLAGDFPEIDGYVEIKESHLLPGGETGTCAVVLASLGCSVKIDGNRQGYNTHEKLTDFFKKICVDTSRLPLDRDFEGLQDLVIIGGQSRTVFGKFQAYFNDGIKRWNEPDREDVANAAVVGLDPFFGGQSDQVASLCRELGKKYVTIDCRHDSFLHRYAEVTAVSHEYIEQQYPGEDIGKLYAAYADATGGLVVFTFGAKNVLYGRRGQEPKSFAPYRVDAVSTLGAGDTFKAGAVYAVLKGFGDADIVRFASAAAAAACGSYPIALHPPTLEKIEALTGRFGY